MRAVHSAGRVLFICNVGVGVTLGLYWCCIGIVLVVLGGGEKLTVASIVPVPRDVRVLHCPLLGGGGLEGVALGQGHRGQLRGAQLLGRLLGGGA